MIADVKVNFSPTHINNYFGDYSGVISYGSSAKSSVKTIEELMLHISDFSGGSKGKSVSKKRKTDSLRDILVLIGDFSSRMVHSVGGFLGNPMGKGTPEQIEETLFQMMYSIVAIMQIIVGVTYTPMIDVMADVMEDTSEIEDISEDDEDDEDDDFEEEFDRRLDFTTKRSSISMLKNLPSEEVKNCNLLPYNVIEKILKPGIFQSKFTISHQEDRVKKNFMNSYANITRMQMASLKC